MKRQRKCRHCREMFLPDSRSYRPTEGGRKVSAQHYCSKPECQHTSQLQSRRASLKKNPLYRQKCLMAARRWRKKHRRYWRERRLKHAEVVKRNRLLQKRRDTRSKVNLANNNPIGAVYAEKLHRIEALVDLANIKPIEVTWTVVSDEIVSFLKWSSHLANIKAIGNRRPSSAQSPA